MTRANNAMSVLFSFKVQGPPTVNTTRLRNLIKYTKNATATSLDLRTDCLAQLCVFGL